MVAMIQLVITITWGTALVLHTRRLYRLAVVPVTIAQNHFVRRKVERMWWWLGRDEFWGIVRTDVERCLQMTVMIALVAWQF